MENESVFEFPWFFLKKSDRAKKRQIDSDLKKIERERKKQQRFFFPEKTLDIIE